MDHWRDHSTSLVMNFILLALLLVPVSSFASASTSGRGPALFPPRPGYLPPGYLPATDSFEIGDFVRSRKQIDRVRRRHPQFLDAFKLQLRLLLQGEEELSLLEWLKGIPRQHLSPEKLAVSLEIVEPGPEKSLQVLEWAREHGFKSPALQQKYIKRLEELGELDLAYTAAREGREKYPEKDVFNLEAGRLVLEKNRLQEAEDLLEKYLQSAPGESEVYLELARLYYKQEREERARDYFSRYRALTPGAESWQEFTE